MTQALELCAMALAAVVMLTSAIHDNTTGFFLGFASILTVVKLRAYLG